MVNGIPDQVALLLGKRRSKALEDIARAIGDGRALRFGIHQLTEQLFAAIDDALFSVAREAYAAGLGDAQKAQEEIATVRAAFAILTKGK